MIKAIRLKHCTEKYYYYTISRVRLCSRLVDHVIIPNNYAATFLKVEILSTLLSQVPY